MANRPIKIVAELETAAVEKGIDKLTKGLHEVPDAAGKASGEMRNLSESTDQTATKTGIMASALGAFADGIDQFLPGAGKYVTALQGAAVGVDVFSNASDVATLALESKYVKLVRDKAATVASTAASLAASAATKVMAAGQWLLNAALTANPIGLVVVGIGALTAGLIIAYKKSEDFRNVVNGMGGALKDVAGGLATATKAVVAFGDAALKSGGDSIGDRLTNPMTYAAGAISGLAGALPGVGLALGAFGLAADKSKNKTDDLTKAIANTGPVAETFADSQKRLADETDAAQKEIDDQKKALDDYIDSLTATQNAVLDLADQEISVAEATANATKAAKENGKSHDVSTEKGRANYKALVDLARATNAQTTANVQNGTSQIVTAAKAEANRKNFVKLATQMGYSGAQADALSRKMVAVPNVSRQAKLTANVTDLDGKIASMKKKLQDPKLTNPEKTKIRADISDLEAKRAQAVRDLAALPKTKTINVNIKYTNTGVNLTTPSSVGRRASGGPVDRNTPYIVGENGPELMVPDDNGTIIPNNKLVSSGGRGVASSAAPTFVINIGTAIGATKDQTERWVKEALEGYMRTNGSGFMKAALAR